MVGYIVIDNSRTKKESDADITFESCKYGRIQPIAYFTITYRDSPGWKTEAYQFGTYKHSVQRVRYMIPM